MTDFEKSVIVLLKEQTEILESIRDHVIILVLDNETGDTSGGTLPPERWD